MKRWIGTFTCMLVCVLAVMTGTGAGQARWQQSGDAEETAYSLTEWFFSQRQADENIAFSPYSLQQIFPLIRDNTTMRSVRDQLSPYIVPGIRREKLDNTTTGELILLDRELTPDYTGFEDGDLRVVSYPGEALQAKKDFQMKILGSVIDNEVPSGNLTFLTAAHYYAEWMTKFDKRLTKNRSFTKENGEVVQVVTMKKHFKDGVGKITADYEMAAVPGKNHYVVYFIKPITDASAVAKNMPAIIHGFENGDGTVNNIDLEVPKISIKNKLDLKPLLQTMNIPAFFDGSLYFDRITGNVPFKLAAASQTVTLDINEDYAEGKALTEIGFRTTACMEEPIIYDIKIDHPYFIIIKDKTADGTGRVVFTAWIANPKA